MSGKEIVREYLPFMPSWTLYAMYGVLLVIVVAAILIVRKKLLHYNVSFPELWKELRYAFKHHRPELRERLLTYIVAQKKVRRMGYAGFMHQCIFYGMILLFIGTFLVFLEQDILKHLGVESLIRGNFYLIYEVVLDTAGLLLLLGIGMALYRRIVIKPAYVHSSWESYALLWGFVYIGVTGFMLEGIRLTLNPVPWAAFSYVGYTLSLLMKGISPAILGTVYVLIWWSHLLIVFAGLVILPVTVMKHMILIPLNMALLPFDREKAKMTTPFKVTELEEMDEESELKIGLSKLDDLTWKQRFNLAACINCGRCESVCPAHTSGRALSPRLLVQKLKNCFDGPLLATEGFFDSGLISEEEVWSCTNCGACVEECPAMIHHVDYIIDMRRYLVSENRLDSQKASVFANLDQNYNPFGLPSYSRNGWLEEMGVPVLSDHPTAEYLYWIGDAGSYDPRAQNIVKSMVEILRQAKVDFAILTYDEKTCGEIAKRMGEEGRYQLIAMENIELLNQFEVKKIITHDPHSYNMLKNEYPEFGGHYEVIHHSVLIEQLLKEKRLTIETKTSERIVYHDPCNLGRWNHIFNEPRQALSRVMQQELLEIPQSKERSFCCGAGGGNYWYKVEADTKISSVRLQQLSAVNPETIAVGCPYCLLMMEDAARTADSEVKIRDLAEIVSEQLQKSSSL